MISHTANNFDLGDRWRAWLREQAYRGPHAAKRIAREWNVSEGTAKLWLSGARPASKHLEAARARWGWLFAQFMFGPPGLNSELDHLKARMARLEQKVIGDEDAPLAAALDAGVLADGGPDRSRSSGVVEVEEALTGRVTGEQP